MPTGEIYLSENRKANRWHAVVTQITIRPEFDERRAAAKRVADDAGAVWVPFQTVFDGAVAAGTPPAYWGSDGVHPSMAGHSLMAKA